MQGMRNERLALTIRKSGSDAGSQLFSVIATFGCLSYIAFRAWQGFKLVCDLAGSIEREKGLDWKAVVIRYREAL
jgi:hypothetical protein